MPGLAQTVVAEYEAGEAWPTSYSTSKLKFQDLSHLFPFCNSCFSILSFKKKKKGKERDQCRIVK